MIAQYNASQLLTQREAVSREIRNQLTRRAAQFNIYLDDVSITQLTFGKEYTQARRAMRRDSCGEGRSPAYLLGPTLLRLQAVEAKQVAQQEAERAKFYVERALQEKQRTILAAQGEAQSAKLIGEAIQKNPAFLSLRRIEAAREIAQTLSNAQNKVYLNAESLLLDLPSGDIAAKK